MAIIELDEDELRRLQAEHAASAPAKKIVDTIVAGKNRLPFLRMVKELSPGTAIPEIDALDAAKPEFAALQAEIDALKAANKAEKEAAEKASREANADG